MEIKIGELVRTKKGKIFKYGKGRTYLGKDNEILKHSFNIIDLIEVGDYVNGHLVMGVLAGAEIIVCCDYKNVCINVYEKAYEKAIESIVTKEQFESITYKL